MDTKIIEQYGEDILCYRLRTARQKKRMQYEDFDKFLIQLDKKERALYRQIRNLGWEPLQPPIQKGWLRCFVLREDVARQKHAAFFENILAKINTYQYDWRKDFKRKKRKLGRKIYVAKQQLLLTPDEWHFKQMNFSEAEQQFLYEIWGLDSYKRPIKQYVFREPWRYVLKVKPNIIDKVKKRDAQLESELSEIADYLKRNDLRKRQRKVLKGYYQYRRWDESEKYNELYGFKNKSLCQILDVIKDQLKNKKYK